MSLALSIDNLGKYYRLGVISGRTLNEDVGRWVARLRGRPDPLTAVAGTQKKVNQDRDSIWALRNIDIQVGHGEVVGIIGHNGAGKSTLLKILARITAPSEGEVKINGRIGSLLEVGTGFHPELTGRENIYLNGTILGMRQKEITKKLDEIISFSGVEQYIDTPVKRYSSGMRVRLAFSVAAHLEPEILLIDEVLAVGDIAFQRKCVGKMSDIASEGRTVLFVSHNMASVESLCQRCVVLKGGHVSFSGDTLASIKHYIADNNTLVPSIDLSNHPNRRSGMKPLLQGLTITTPKDEMTNSIRVGEDVVFNVKVDPLTESYPSGSLSIALYTPLNQLACSMKSNIQSSEIWHLRSPGTMRCTLKDMRLIPGTYTVSIACTDHRATLDWVDRVATIEVLPSDIYNTGQSGRLRGGFIVPTVQWDMSDFAKNKEDL